MVSGPRCVQFQRTKAEGGRGNPRSTATEGARRGLVAWRGWARIERWGRRASEMRALLAGSNSLASVSGASGPTVFSAAREGRTQYCIEGGLLTRHGMPEGASAINICPTPHASVAGPRPAPRHKGAEPDRRPTLRPLKDPTSLSGSDTQLNIYAYASSKHLPPSLSLQKHHPLFRSSLGPSHPPRSTSPPSPPSARLHRPPPSPAHQHQQRRTNIDTLSLVPCARRGAA